MQRKFWVDDCVRKERRTSQRKKDAHYDVLEAGWLSDENQRRPAVMACYGRRPTVMAVTAAAVVDIQYKIANECNLTLEPSIFKVALQWCFGQKKKRRVTRLAIFVFL